MAIAVSKDGSAVVAGGSKGSFAVWQTATGEMDVSAGGMKGNRHIRYAKPTPLANLHLSLLDKVGVRLESFGDSTGKIDNLFEPLSV